MSDNRSAFERVYDIVRQIPRGRVTTYGRIAALLGNPRMSRVVGYALHVGKDPASIPYHRVVNRKGGLSDVFIIDGFHEQRHLLDQEGVEFNDEDCVDLERFMWYGPEPGLETRQDRKRPIQSGGTKDEKDHREEAEKA